MADQAHGTQLCFSKLAPGNDKVALTFSAGSCTYAELDQRINQFACGLLGTDDDLSEERIAFLIPGSVDYVTSLFGVWKAGGISVPLNVASAIPELEHALSSAGIKRLIANGEYQEKVRDLCASLEIEMLSVDDVRAGENKPLPKIDSQRRAMILFTSGTTNKPKGVVTTHLNIHSQVTTLIEAWAWQEIDTIPLFLPLHHGHGIINVLCCGLCFGASNDVFTKFNMEEDLTVVSEGMYSVFMAVRRT